MILLIPVLLAAVLIWMWLARRGSSLTRSCRWRLERSAGRWRCASCGAVAAAGGTAGDRAPRHCGRARMRDAPAARRD